MKNKLVNTINIQDKIYLVRNNQVMLDQDLAILYGVSTKRLNEQLRRNLKRFPIEFCYQTTKAEYEKLRSQFATFNNKVGRKYLPYVFTEQGVAMLSAILKSDTAIKVSIQIMTAFVQMRKYINTNYQLYERVKEIEKNQIIYGIKTDKKFDQVFKAIVSNNVIPKQKIFYEGQTFDAHVLISKIIRSAKKDILLIDNFIDDTVLILLTKCNPKIKITIYCKKISPQLRLDVKKYNTQYPAIEIREFQLSHDRFIVIDQKTTYHLGASLKDLGKKWFAVSKFNNQSLKLLRKLSSY